MDAVSKAKLRKLGVEALNYQKLNEECNIITHIQHFIKHANNYQAIASFLNYGNEFNSRLMLEIVHEQFPHLKFFAPRVLTKVRDGAKMDFYALEFTNQKIDYTCLEQNNWGIWEPKLSNASLLKSIKDSTIEVDEILFIIPGLLFDQNKQRLGYGGGYYDRYLQDFKGKSTLLSAVKHKQLYAANLPCEDHDIKLDFLILEDRIIF